jgi:dTDP-4-dehydrorhamnose 3,5-epimerase
VKVIATELPGVLILEPKVFGDARGFFFESFNQKLFDAAVGSPVTFVQDNHSHSSRGVLRGLHLQREPHAQGKLVRAMRGKVFDVAVDLRRDSPTFRRWLAVELDDVAHRQLWIPAGLAHGFVVMSESADVQYKTTDYYAPAAEISIRWDDRALAIAWPDIGMPFSLSAKDRDAPDLQAALSER